jgi:hypothetical protein
VQQWHCICTFHAFRAAELPCKDPGDRKNALLYNPAPPFPKAPTFVGNSTGTSYNYKELTGTLKANRFPLYASPF